MATMEQYYDVSTMQNISDDKSSLNHLKQHSSDSSGGFDCNICLYSVEDPVVTLCGHLYCWPCIYKWLNFQTQQQQHLCPVCRSQLSHSSLVPLYGKGQTRSNPPSKTKSPLNLGIVIPRRPLGPPCGAEMPTSNATALRPPILNRNYVQRSNVYASRSRSYDSYSSMLGGRSTMAYMLEPMIGVFGETLYDSSNSYHLLGSNSPRLRRHILQVDKSLNRVCSFLFCCLILCLLLF